jgi:SAM-dependent methyltransferase
MKSLSPELRDCLRPVIEPATQHYLQRYTSAAALTLEVGCGPGQYRLAVKGSYVGVDITANDYNEELPRTPDVLADAMHLPFEGKAFDLVFFSNIFHYFDEPGDALGQAGRVLKPQGHLLIFDYSRRTLERLRAAYARSSPGYTAHPRTCSEWIALLRGAGFVKVELRWKSLSAKYRALELLNRGPLRPLYFSVIDRGEGSIVLLGQKPGEVNGG